MPLTLKDLLRELSVRCDDVVEGIATTGTSTSLTDSRLSSTFADDDVFNGGRLVINADSGRMLFIADCETAPETDWTSVTVTDNDCKLFRDRTYKKTGRWSYKALTGADASDVAYVSKTLDTGYTTVYAQAHVYSTTDYTGRSDILALLTNAGTQVVCVRLTNGSLSIYNTAASATYTPTSATLSNDAWHRIELACVVSATVGQVMLWVDEALVYSGRGLNTGSTAIQKVAVGHVATTTAEAKSIWFDDVKVDQEYIGDRDAETEKAISDYTGSTGKLDWSGAIVAPTANLTRYAIYDWPKAWRSPSQKKRAINNAIRQMFPTWFTEAVDPPDDYGNDASLTAVQNQFAYELPAACEAVLNVWIESATTTAPYWRDVTWSVDASGGVKYLRLPNAGSLTTGLDIRVHYIARPVPLVNDNDELNVAEAYLGDAQEYIMNYALAALWSNTGTPSRDDEAKASYHMQIAEGIRQRRPMPMPARTMQIEAAVRARSFDERIIHP